MGDVSSAIDSFITDHIALSRDDISSAVASREWLLGRIKGEIEKRTNEPVLYTAEPFVFFGSYFKRTKVASVDEFDILVVIDTNGGFYTNNGLTVGTGVGSASPNPLFSGNYDKTGTSVISPAKLLNWVKSVTEAVVSPYNGAAPERNGQAVTAYIKSKDLKIDLVPACILQRGDGTTFYAIPRGDANGGWIATAPRDDIELLATVADGKPWFRDVIRLCKYIRTAYNFKVSSFAVESAIVQYGQANYWYQVSLDENVYGVLNHLASVFRLGSIADPFDSTNNLVSGVDSLWWYADRLDGLVAGLKALKTESDQSKVQSRVDQLFMNS